MKVLCMKMHIMLYKTVLSFLAHRAVTKLRLAFFPLTVIIVLFHVTGTIEITYEEA